VDPLVSICLPSLNQRPFLEERMTSLLEQTMRDWELIVCDSHSDDGSWEYLQKFRNDPRVRLHRVAREGAYAGWNECLRRARGRYCYIAPSDDTMRPELLERLAGALEAFPQISVAVCDLQPIDDRSRPIELSTDRARRAFFGSWLDTGSVRSGQTEFLLHACFIVTWVSMTAVLFRRDLLERTGLFRTDRGSTADVEWALRAALASDLVYVPGRLATWRVHPDQATQQLTNRSILRHVLASIDTVINDPRAGVPDHWTRVPGWQQELRAVWEIEYLDTFGLYRGVARRQPARFLRNCWDAARAAPGFLLHQATRGFAWSEQFSPDPGRQARHLIELFNAPWPPEPVTADAER